MTGIGKRTAFEEYRVQSCGGKLRITMKVGDKTGGVIGALTVRDTDEIPPNLALALQHGQFMASVPATNPHRIRG